MSTRNRVAAPLFVRALVSFLGRPELISDLASSGTTQTVQPKSSTVADTFQVAASPSRNYKDAYAAHKAKRRLKAFRLAAGPMDFAKEWRARRSAYEHVFKTYRSQHDETVLSPGIGEKNLDLFFSLKED